MDALFLGIPDVVPRCVLWISRGISTGTYHREKPGAAICKITCERFVSRYRTPEFYYKKQNSKNNHAGFF
jgi:hypothetical protein